MCIEASTCRTEWLVLFWIPTLHIDLERTKIFKQLFEITYAEGWAVSYKLVESFFLSCPQAFFAADDGNRTIGRAKSSRLRYIWLSNLIHEEFLIFSHKIVWYYVRSCFLSLSEGAPYYGSDCERDHLTRPH